MPKDDFCSALKSNWASKPNVEAQSWVQDHRALSPQSQSLIPSLSFAVIPLVSYYPLTVYYMIVRWKMKHREMLLCEFGTGK